MKKLILVAAGGLLLATASSPPPTEGELSSVVAAPAPQRVAAAPARAARSTYPRCSATLRDRCVQGRSRAAHPARHEIQLAMRAGERG